MSDIEFRVQNLGHYSPNDIEVAEQAVKEVQTLYRSSLVIADDFDPIAEGTNTAIAVQITPESTQRVIGAISIRIPLDSDQRHLVIAHSAVQPDVRRQGVGNALVSWAEGMASNHMLRLVVAQPSPGGSIPLLKRRGYEQLDGSSSVLALQITPIGSNRASQSSKAGDDSVVDALIG